MMLNVLNAKNLFLEIIICPRFEVLEGHMTLHISSTLTTNYCVCKYENLCTLTYIKGVNTQLSKNSRTRIFYFFLHVRQQYEQIPSYDN